MRTIVISLGILLLVPAPGVARQAETAKPAAQASGKKPAATTETKPQEPALPAPEPKAEAASESAEKASDHEQHYEMTEVPPIVTHHQINLDGKPLAYTATAGRLPIKRDDGKIEVEMFFVAYALDGQSSAKRPLTFCFNGGPGSSTVWLHMGAVGPRTVVLQPNGFMPAAPYRMTDNPDTLLDRSDLVFVDAIATGFSRAADSETTKKFLGVKGDIEAFGEFIRLYLTRYERWASPLFLLGESYGTTRAAGIANYLADRGYIVQRHRAAVGCDGLRHVGMG